MTKKDRKRLIEYLIDLDPDISLDEASEDSLIGYAERFGCEFIPMYEGVNTFLFKTPDETIEAVSKLTDKACLFDGLKKSIIGYIVLEQGGIAILHDKETLLNNLAKEYEDNRMEIDEDDSYYNQAVQWYDYNIIGTGLSDAITPAFSCTDYL